MSSSCRIAAASGGRGYLGLARGAWLDAVGIVQDRPLTRLREAAALVRALLSGDETGFAGREFQLAPGTRLVAGETGTVEVGGPATARVAERAASAGRS